MVSWLSSCGPVGRREVTNLPARITKFGRYTAWPNSDGKIFKIKVAWDHANQKWHFHAHLYIGFAGGQQYVDKKFASDDSWHKKLASQTRSRNSQALTWKFQWIACALVTATCDLPPRNHPHSTVGSKWDIPGSTVGCYIHFKLVLISFE
jgi:hypothetical protein